MQITPFLARNKLRIAVYGLIVLVLAYAFFIEPNWISVKNLRLSDKPTIRLVHITDIHYHGEDGRLEEAVETINALKPDLVCVTGDLVDEKKRMLPEVLAMLSQIRCPVFGVPGNHEFLSGINLDEIARAFERTGGAFLTDQRLIFRDLEIIGMQDETYKKLPRGRAARKSLLLTHYPALAKTLGAEKFDLILAGHSHGGQIRLPAIGALMLPYGADGYERGLYHTPAGPLYVNPGLGNYGIPARLLCRPEVTLIEF